MGVEVASGLLSVKIARVFGKEILPARRNHTNSPSLKRRGAAARYAKQFHSSIQLLNFFP